MEVLTHPILLDKQIDTVFLKRPLRAPADAKQRLVGKRWVGLACSQGTPVAIFQRQNVSQIYFPFVNHLSELNELPFFKKPRKKKITYFE